MDFTLTPEQERLKERARRFALKELLPVAHHYDQKDEMPGYLLRRAYEEGFLNMGLPAEYGGSGLGLLEAALVMEELASACPGVATSIFDNSLGMEPLLLSSNEPLKREVLPKLANGEGYIAFALSETGAGSDVAGIGCRAVKDGEDYILKGRKYWITNAGIADYFTVFATLEPAARHLGICAFLVERGWEGVKVGSHIPKLGQRTSNTAAIRFDNVRVPASNLLAEPPRGFILAMRTFARTRAAIGSFAVGAARSAMDFAIRYAKKRRTFGKKLFNYQMIQQKVAEMYADIETGRLLVHRAAWEADRGDDSTISASIAKIFTTESAIRVVNEALQIFGGYGYTRLFPLEKLLRDVRLFTIYEGSSEILRKLVAEYAFTKYKPVMPPYEEVNGFNDREQKGWRCRICGHIHVGDEPPEECPICLFPASSFTKIG